jgi:hypothetical protein
MFRNEPGENNVSDPFRFIQNPRKRTSSAGSSISFGTVPGEVQPLGKQTICSHWPSVDHHRAEPGKTHPDSSLRDISIFIPPGG